MLICQISDIHIGFEGDTPRERNTVRCQQVIDHIAALDPAPDLVVVTGDLTEHGNAAAYRRLKTMLSALAMPVLVMAGNHDRRAALLEIFDDTPTWNGFIQSARSVGADQRLILLDTLEEGRNGGGFCDNRAQWLETRLGEAPDTPTIVALHHPPFPIGIDWIDPAGEERWIGRLHTVISRHPQICALIAGHVHRPVTGNWAGKPCVIASSVAPQLAFDLRPTPVGQADGRAMIVVEPPAYVLHRWIGHALTSHFVRVEASAPIAWLDADMSEAIAGFKAEAERS